MHTTFSLAGLRPARGGARLTRGSLNLAMLEWSDVDIAVRDAVREFVDKEVRPHVDALESGEMEPYPIIRKLFATFGIDAMARDSLEKRLARMRDGSGLRRRAGVGGMFGGDGASAGMGFVVVSELCRVCMGVVTGMGVSLGLTVPTIMGRGTLAQQERWLPGLVTYEKVGAWAITEPDSGFGRVRRDEVLRGAGWFRRLHPQRPEDLHHQRSGRRRRRRVRQARTRATPLDIRVTARC